MRQLILLISIVTSLYCCKNNSQDNSKLRIDTVNIPNKTVKDTLIKNIEKGQYIDSPF